MTDATGTTGNILSDPSAKPRWTQEARRSQEQSGPSASPRAVPVIRRRSDKQTAVVVAWSVGYAAVNTNRRRRFAEPATSELLLNTLILTWLSLLPRNDKTGEWPADHTDIWARGKPKDGAPIVDTIGFRRKAAAMLTGIDLKDGRGGDSMPNAEIEWTHDVASRHRTAIKVTWFLV